MQKVQNYNRTDNWDTIYQLDTTDGEDQGREWDIGRTYTAPSTTGSTVLFVVLVFFSHRAESSPGAHVWVGPDSEVGIGALFTMSRISGMTIGSRGAGSVSTYWPWRCRR